MATEEQIQEIEVLQSIYPDEFTQITPTQFTICLVLEPPSIPGQSHEPPIINLHVTYPPTYPDTPPDLDLTIDAASPPSSLSFPTDKDTLLSTLADTATENLGMAMVFTLATTLKDAAEELLASRAQAVESRREERLRAEEEREMEKFRGTLVTRERFVEWLAGFRAEEEEKRRAAVAAREEEEKGKRGTGVKEKRLTGRQLYERGLVGGTDDAEDVEEDGVEVDLAKLKVSA
ncbi:RWD domain-containing protein [Morchella snyderi]|nr:RWD domain-containing protein [Morchella snyderi]